jgi:hypothetical protein
MRSNGSLRRILVAGAGIGAISCLVLILAAGRSSPTGELSSSFLPSTIRNQPAAQYIQHTLRGLNSDAEDKLRGIDLHRHRRVREHSRRHAARTKKAHRDSAFSLLDPDRLEPKLASKFDRFNRGQTLADLQRSLGSSLFSATAAARKEPAQESARIAQLERAQLPGALAVIPRDMLPVPARLVVHAKTLPTKKKAGVKAPAADFKAKARTTMLTMNSDGLGYRGVNVGYTKTPAEYVPRTGGRLMHNFGVNTGEEGAWAGEDHWADDDEQEPIDALFTGPFLHGDKYWAPLFGARAPQAVARPTQLAELERADVEDHNGIPELHLAAAMTSVPHSRSPEQQSARGRAAGLLLRAKEQAGRAGVEQRGVAIDAEAAAEDAAWVAAGSRGPVDGEGGEGGVRSARVAAQAMEDGAVGDEEEREALETLRAAMTDAQQEMPGHREHVKSRPRLTTRCCPL